MITGQNPSPLRFVLTEHHASALHWDLRFESEGMLLSWALPKGEPTETGQQRLALRTDDHDLDFLDPAKTIARAAAARSSVLLTDSGTYEREFWAPQSRIVVVLHGDAAGTRRLMITRTARMGPKSWLAKRVELAFNEPDRTHEQR